MRTSDRARARGLVLSTALLLVPTSALGCGSSDRAANPAVTGGETGGTTGGTIAVEPVVRAVLAEMADPPGAPGRTLTLIRYTIAPGAKLAPHIHPGVQMASIESGTLTYTIESGTAIVRRKGASADERIEGPATTTLAPGDAVDEVGDMVHFGANETAEPVVILATLLTEDGKGLAVTVGSTAPPA